MLIFPGWDGYWINKPLRNEVGRNFILEKILSVAEMDGKAIVEIEVDFHLKLFCFCVCRVQIYWSNFEHCLMRADSYLDISTCKDACLRVSATLANSMDTSGRWHDDSFLCAFIQFLAMRRHGIVHMAG